VVLATVVGLDGQPTSRSGAKALLSRGALLAGTLGCSEFDSAALADAGALLEAGSPRIARYSHDLGHIDVYLEPYAGRPTLLVVAATPVAAELLRWAPDLGFRTVLLENRPERLAGRDWPAGTLVASLAGLEGALGGELYAVHTDHDAPDLVELLELVLARGPRFLGLMGSRRHTGHHLDALAARGMDPAAIELIQSPVGLDLGAQTPAEIAVSILAGLVAVRRGASGGWKENRLSS
jgi:xanthine dehydrogenase accessory factor